MRFIVRVKKITDTTEQPRATSEYLFDVDYHGRYNNKLVMGIIEYIQCATVILQPNELLIPTRVEFDIPECITYTNEIQQIYLPIIQNKRIVIVQYKI